jgi:hypothetical protein
VPVPKYCAVYILRFDSFYAMDEVIGSIPIRQSASKLSAEISQWAQFSQDARQLGQFHPTGSGMAFPSLRRTNNLTK